jgi:hypothetical protein
VATVDIEDKRGVSINSVTVPDDRWFRCVYGKSNPLRCTVRLSFLAKGIRLNPPNSPFPAAFHREDFLYDEGKQANMAANSSNADVIDWHEAMQQCGEDEEFLRELLNDLRSETETQVSNINKTIQVRSFLWF